MPERWETELHRLRSVERPATLEDRVAEGPRHEPGRPTGERVAAAVVAFAVCAAVALAGFQVLRSDGGGRTPTVGDGVPSGEGALVLVLTSSADAPEASLRYGDEELDVVVEGYTWCPDGETSECTSLIADFATWPPANDFAVAPPSTPIVVEGDGSIDTVEVLDTAGEPIPGEDGSTVPATDGRYVFHVNAAYPNGSASLFFGVQALGDVASAPDVLTVDCSVGFPKLDTSIVRTQVDGLHIGAVGATDGFEILDVADDLAGVGTGADVPDGAESAWGIDPGIYRIGCGRHVDAASAVPFELIDPDDHHAPEQVACGSVPQSWFTSSVPGTVEPADAAGQLLTGLVEGDRIRGAGYGAETWHLGPAYVVDRGGEAVARVVLGEQGEVWTGSFETCESSGIELSDVATVTGGSSAPSEGGIPDVLVARCEGLGTAIDADAVVAQPDGLVHILAENVADAALITLESGDGPVVGATWGFDTAKIDVAAELEPGIYWIGCRVTDEQGDVDGGRAEHPEAYVVFEVLPPEA